MTFFANVNVRNNVQFSTYIKILYPSFFLFLKYVKKLKNLNVMHELCSILYFVQKYKNINFLNLRIFVIQESKQYFRRLLFARFL